MNKIEFPVQSGHGDPFHLADTMGRYLVDEKKAFKKRLSASWMDLLLFLVL
jgi:hypothetical protein